jgi:hypothetical protein
MLKHRNVNLNTVSLKASDCTVRHLLYVHARTYCYVCIHTVLVIRNYICSVYMGNACIRAYGDSLIKVILAGKVAHISHKTCKYNFLLPVLYIYTIHTYVQGQRVGKHFVKINKVHNIGNTFYLPYNWYGYYFKWLCMTHNTICILVWCLFKLNTMFTPIIPLH